MASLPTVLVAPEVYQRRRDRLRSAVAARFADASTADQDGAPVEAFVVSSLVNVRYLSGFTGSNAAVLCDLSAPDGGSTGGGDLIVTDGRYRSQVAQQSPDLAALIERDVVGAACRTAGARGRRRVAFEAEHLTVAALARLSDGLGGSVELVPCIGVVEELRAVKEQAEVDLLAQACAAADRALAAIIDAGEVAPGRTERQVARALEWAMFTEGADAVAFETIVAAGANSAIPHHRPTDAVLASGDFVKIDFGAVVGGYHSDMTRTYVLDHVADWQREVYELVAQAQAAGRAALRPGADLREVDAAARDVIVAAGHGEHYVHGLGHGVGLEIHEAPPIGAGATGTLPLGAAVTVEPGVYLPGAGGVRIEDTLVVTDADPLLLTTTDKTLTVI